MSELAFISPGSARPEGEFTPRASSPLARALAGAKGIRDLSQLGKLEVRGREVIGGLSDDVEVIPIQKVNEAYERLLSSNVKYRFSIDMASLKAE